MRVLNQVIGCLTMMLQVGKLTLDVFHIINMYVNDNVEGGMC